MSTEDSELRFGSNKILISIKIGISVLLCISAMIIEKILGKDGMSKNTSYFLNWVFGLGFNSFIIFLCDLRERYIILSLKGLTYKYYGAFKQEIYHVFDWNEIEKFEKLNSFVFYKKIRIILKKQPFVDARRNCKIWIHNSKTPRDESYNLK